ncbi:MAG: MFS transporter [Candidatus Latescibacteria bacterium]|nr:MFS transporter [Candidatus Latescibacterota bacterium]
MVSQIGSQAFVVAAMFWIKHATESATLMGVVMMLGTLPFVLLGAIGGVVADRASRKRVLIACDLIAGGAVLLLSLAVATVPHATAFLIAVVCLVSAILGAVGAFFHPAIIAVTPSLVPPERLAAANSLREASGDTAALVGQAAGGVALRILGAPILFLIDGVSYLFAAASTSLARIPHHAGAGSGGEHPSVRSALRQGFGFIGEQRGLTSLVIVATLANFFAAPFIVVLPFFVEDTLRASSDWFGYLIACAGGGGLLGYLVAGSIQHARGAFVLLACLCALSVCIFALALVSTTFAAAALLVAVGTTGAVFNVGAVTVLQRGTPDAFRGRVFGLVQALAMATTPLAMLLAGVVADALGRDARLVFAGCGVALVAVTLAAAMHRPLRNYLNDRTDAS